MRISRLALALTIMTGCTAEVASVEPAAVDTPTTVAASDVATTTAATATAATVEFGPLPDLAVTSTDGFVAVVRGGEVADAVPGIVAPDARTLIETTAVGDTTTVSWIDLSTGDVTASLTLAGLLTAVATDLTGRVVALRGDGALDTGGTEIVVATAAQGEAFRHSYGSELLPEGFDEIYDSGPLPLALYVIEFLEPSNDAPDAIDAPRRYRIRTIDLASGDMQLPWDLREKTQIDEEMLGFSRTHVLAPGKGLLFTLYRGLEADDSQYAFVHTLGFTRGVYCLDLPPELWLERLPGAVALLDNESTLLVVSANGYVTEFGIDDITDPTRDPLPRRTEQAWSSGPNPAAPSVAADGGVVLVGQGSTLRWLDADTLVEHARLDWDMTIEAVALLDNGDAISVGTRRISQITPDGQLAAERPLPNGFGTVASVTVLGA